MLLLSVQNIMRRFGSSVATACIVALTLAITVTGGASFLGLSDGVRKASERLGADIVVLPSEVGVSAQEALFTAEPANIYLPKNVEDIVAPVDGVARVTPQFFTQTLNQSCCSVLGVTRVVGIDLSSDFVISPWLSESGLSHLEEDQIVLGANAPEVTGNLVSILGNKFKVAARLDPTGTSVDETIFMDIDVARRIGAESEYLQGVWRTTDPYSSISALMVKVEPGADPEVVASAIEQVYPNASVTAVSGLVKNTSDQLDLFMKVFAALTLSILAIAIISLAGRFSSLAKDRRGEIGLMRALGFSSGDCLKALMLEIEMLSLAGGVVGSFVGICIAIPLSSSFHTVLALPKAGLSVSALVILWCIGVLLALLLGAVSSLGTALRYSKMDPQKALQRGDLQ